MTNKYVYELPAETQKDIERELITAITDLGIYDEEEEICASVQDGMDSRLIDLAELFDIEQYV